MTAKRKTITVEAVKDLANNMLKFSDEDKAEGRVAVALLLERVLMNTGNYVGFTYLASEYAPTAAPESERDPDAPPLRLGYDDTRRRYH